MKAPKFREFISEAPDNGKYKLLVITDEPEKAKTFHTADRLREEAEKLGWKYYLYKLTGGYTTSPEGALRLHNKDDDKGFEVSGLDTIAIIRGSVTRKDSWMDIVSLLEKHSICVVNSRETISVCADKYRTSLRLADYGVKQPVTHLINDPDNSEQAFENLNTQYPVILKTLRGSKGVGVLFVESSRALDSIVQLIHKQDEDADLLLQEYIKTDYDARVLVLGGKVLSTMKRPVIEGDFRSNVSQGAKVKSYKLSEDEKIMCLKAAKAVGGTWTGVDFIKDKKDKVYILEINSSPGTEGVEKATKDNITKNILEYFKDKNVWTRTPTPCGYYETVDIKPFGTLVAKFDTGNVLKSVIHAEDVKIKDDKVTFTCNDKTLTAKLEGKYTSMTGAGPEERYFIKLDVTFLGHTYKDVDFGLDDRSHFGTNVLLNRGLMNSFNVIVSPSKKYLMTTYKEIK